MLPAPEPVPETPSPSAEEPPSSPEAATSRRGRSGRRGGRRPQAADAAQPEGQLRPDAAYRGEAEEGPRPAPERPGPGQGAQRNGFERGRAQTGSEPGQRVAQSAAQPRGAVESLIARQNVLFEEFTSHQTQALQEIQRTVQGLGGRTAGTGAGGTAIMPKVGVFLDVPNLMYAAEVANVRVHFGKLLAYLTQGRQLVRATAYAPITDDPLTRYELQRFVAPVINQGYKVVTKPWKRFADGGMKANFDIELAVDILTMADRLDVVVLLSGDGDFRRVLELVESKGVRVEVVAFAASTALELRSVADQYTDVGAILSQVSV